MKTELEAIVKNNLAAFWKCCFSTDPHYSVFEKDAILKAVSDINDPIFNAVLASNIKENELNKSIEDVVAYFAEKNLSFCWWVNTAADSPNLGKSLQKINFDLFGDVSGMVLDLEKSVISHQKSNQFEITQVTATEELANWSVPIQVGFGMSADSIKKYLRIFEKINESSGPPFHHFVAKLKDKVIGSATLFLDKDVAGIYNCATFPENRRHGVLSQLTSVLLNHAKNLGFKKVTLQASPMSVGVFQQFGFKIIIPYQIHLKKMVS